MPHIRQQVREAMVSVITGQTSAGSRVYSNRVLPTAEAQLPFVSVSVVQDAAVRETIGPLGTTQRTLEIEAKVYAKATKDVDDVLDGIASSIEAAVYADDSFGGICRYCQIEETTIDFASEAETTIGELTMTFEAQTRVRPADPETVDL